MDVAIFSIPDNSKNKKIRNKRKMVTTPQQKNLNDKRSKRYFRQLVHTNFVEKGYHLTLTYSDNYLPEDLDAAKKHTDNFIRKLKRRCNKLSDKTLKYIIVDEYSESGRIHHHIILDCALDREVIENCWNYGRKNCDVLQPNEKGLIELCNYLMKSTEDKMIKNGKTTRRWRASKNLKKPVEVTNDNKYNRRKLSKLIIDMENKEQWKRLYPNWEIIDVTAEANEYLGYSLYVKFRRK